MLMTYQNPQMHIYYLLQASLVRSDTDISTLYQRANVEMNNLFEWFCANGLSLNKNKTKYMVFKGGTNIWILTSWTFQLVVLI